MSARDLILLCGIALVCGMSQWNLFRSADDLRTFIDQSGFSTDKTTWHTYETMYWAALNRVLSHSNSPPRMFEIGLGCFMQFGPGGSARLWKKLFPHGVIHMFEYSRECGEEWERANPSVATVHYGDQGNPSDLRAAVGELLPFDLIVDDGSHMGSHQLISLKTLWPSVRPGGVYIVEDVHGSCTSWKVPGQTYETGGREDCMHEENGSDTFFAYVVKNWLPVLVRSRDSSPQELPNLESITFYHEAIMFTKK
jgi:hypothetical protein